MSEIARFALYVKYTVVAAWLSVGSFAFAHPLGSPANSKDLEGHLWVIPSATFDDTRIHPRLSDGSEVYLMFKGGKVTGKLGCGAIFGEYSFSESRLAISVKATSDTHNCGVFIGTQSEQLTAALNSARAIEGGGDDAFYLFDELKKTSIRLELRSPGSDLSELRASFWQLVTLEGEPVVNPNAEVRLGKRTIQVDRGTLYASHMFDYRLKKFDFRPAWSTNARGEHGTFPPFFVSFKKALNKITRYSVSGDDLTAYDATGQQVMLLRRINSTGLEYRYWHIAEYAVTGELKQTFSSQFQYVTFARGEVEGTAGCGSLDGKYKLAGDDLSIEAGSSLVGGICPDEAEKENDLVIEALKNATRVKRDGTRMLLLDAQGKTQIVLTPYFQQAFQ